ncbi:MAG: hypothetical protein NT167_26775 [Verrucomicrobia bacterium]|nr:hypothetical protein [Verrucomicrobiota bacterium]
MSTNAIPVEAREAALRSIACFNQEILAGMQCRYIPRFRGKYLYLDREDFGNIGSICRLDYNRRKRLWEFAIYKYSAERYDSEEWFFPGSDLVDGTIEGAMKAGMKAYQ